MPLAQVTLTGTITDGEGNPVGGILRLVPSLPLADPADQQVIRQAQVNIAVGTDGVFAAALYATDNANLEPSGWAWAVLELLNGIPQSAYTSWSFYLPAQATAFTATDASPAVFTAEGMSLFPGMGVQLAGASLPAGFTAGTTYYVTGISGATFSLAATEGGPALASTSTGSGTVSVVQQDISTVEPVYTGPVTPEYPYLPTAGGSLTGPLELLGNPPLVIPGGAVDGYMLTSDADGNATWQVMPGMSILAQSAVVTANYVAAINQIVPVSTASGNVIVSLPNAPAGGTLVVVKHIIQGGTNTVSVETSGSDVFNKAGGSTSETLSLVNQGLMVEYNSGIWMVLADDLPLAGTDARYVQQSSLPLAVASGGTGQTAAPAAGAALGGPGDWYNVKAYGAAGNGTTNDTTSIQAAITAAGTAGGGNVYFPYTSGGYLCGALSLPPGVRLIGANGAYLTAPSSLAASWVLATSAVHQGTAVIGLTFIATAVTSSSCTAVINFAGTTSCPNVRIENNRLVNSPVHGIYMSEATYTLAKKWICENSVEEHGLVATGFGIYCDYVGSVEIDRNYVYTAGADDSIEMGHSGPAYLTIDAHLRATHNTVVGGQLQFPFSHYAEILGNTVIGNTIQNDTNTANYVQIIGNTVIGATPASGYAGIRVAGSYAVISGNRVNVTTGNGIAGTTMTGFTVTGNYVYSSYATSGGSGSAIYDGGSGADDNVFTGNILDGTAGEGFTYAFNLGGEKSSVTGNAIHNGGCYNGITGGGTYLRITGNTLDYYNVGVVSVGANTVLRDNFGYNPVGSVSVAVPSSGSAVAAAAYDRTFYVTAAATGTTTMAISGGPTVTIPVSMLGTIHVPAMQTLTPTYTSAPTWVVEGE